MQRTGWQSRTSRDALVFGQNGATWRVWRGGPNEWECTRTLREAKLSWRVWAQGEQTMSTNLTFMMLVCLGADTCDEGRDLDNLHP